MMGTDLHEGDPQQVETVAEAANQLIEPEQEKPSDSPSFETRIDKLETAMEGLKSDMVLLKSTMKELTGQLSALRPDAEAGSKAVIGHQGELNEFLLGAERSGIGSSQGSDWLSAFSESERAELKRKKAQLDNILTSLME